MNKTLLKTMFLLAAASVTACQRIPDRDMPGGILSGNELARERTAQGMSASAANSGPIIPTEPTARSAAPATMPAAPAAPAAPSPAEPTTAP